MNTLLLDPITSSTIKGRSDLPNSIDITRGARLIGIDRPRIAVQSDVLENYCELDSALGQNLTGVILSVLACHLGNNPGGTYDDRIEVCALRRDDAAPVEISLELHRFRDRGSEYILLVRRDERSLSSNPLEE